MSQKAKKYIIYKWNKCVSSWRFVFKTARNKDANTRSTLPYLQVIMQTTYNY